MVDSEREDWVGCKLGEVGDVDVCGICFII